MRIRATLASIAMFAVTASASSAATIMYDFKQNLSDTSATASYTVDGVTLTVDSFGGNLNRGRWGLGVQGNPEGGRLGSGELLAFSFDRDIVSITTTVFETGNEDEDFRFFGIGNGNTVTVAGGGNGRSFTSYTENLASAVTSFGVIGLEPNAAGNRGIRIASIEIELAPIPLPASGALLGAALLGLGLRRRSKTS